MKLLKLLPLVALIACGDKEDTGTSVEPATEPAEEPAEEPAGEPAGEPSEETGPDLANGGSIHDNVCLVCHASNPAMADRVPNMTDEEIGGVLENGIGQMPAQNVTGDDLVDLLAFLRQEYP